MFDNLTTAEAVALELRLMSGYRKLGYRLKIAKHSLARAYTPVDKLAASNRVRMFEAMRREFQSLHFDLMNRAA